MKTEDEIVEDLRAVLLNACKIFENDGTKAVDWVFTPSDELYGASPLMCIFAESADAIINWQKALLGEGD